VAAAHTLAAVFSSRDAAARSVRVLERAGIPPWRVEVVEDPRRALDIGVRRYVREGALAGLVIGVVFVLVGVAILHVSLPGFEGVVPPLAVTAGWTLIGALVGYGVKRTAPDASLFESTMRAGGAVVAVRCADDCDMAEHAFAEAGASEILDETERSL
jgi:hypothetical protein